jgi:Ca-activated chloride channel family protein
VPAVLVVLSLLLLTVALAGPTAEQKVPRNRATVMLVIDVSLSMEATDVLPSRLQAAQAAAEEFTDLLPKRINLGLVKFGRAGNVLVPPTQDRDAVKRAIAGLQLEQYTAIGEGVFACLDALNTFSQSSTTPGEKPAPARIVLLSDGFNTVGRKVADAAAAAKKANTPVSTIAFGTDTGTVDLDGTVQQVPSDKVTLRGLAEATGGSFHTATSQDELRSVYKDIGSQIGYTKAQRDISWRFMFLGLLLALTAGAASLLWSGRLA